MSKPIAMELVADDDELVEQLQNCLINEAKVQESSYDSNYVVAASVPNYPVVQYQEQPSNDIVENNQGPKVVEPDDDPEDVVNNEGPEDAVNNEDPEVQVNNLKKVKRQRKGIKERSNEAYVKKMKAAMMRRLNLQKNYNKDLMRREIKLKQALARIALKEAQYLDNRDMALRN